VNAARGCTGWLIAATLLAAGCGGGDAPATAATADPLDTRLRALIATHRLTGDPAANAAVEPLDAPLAQLGMRLFFSTSLSGDFDVACASCHHPALAGGDALSLPVGIGAIDPAVLGPGRSSASGAPNVPRHAPTTFNAGLLVRVLFHDGRVEQLQPGQIQADAGIRTPDVPFGLPDPEAGPSLLAAQARFPVTVDAEMRGAFLAGATGAQLRERLAQRLGGYGDGTGELARNEWLPLFQAAFGGGEPATAVVTFDNVALALAAYQRSQVFVDTPWRDYVRGDAGALGPAAKRGGILFFTPANEGGAGCVQCHLGDRFSDEAFHAIALPQIGPGKGDGPAGDDDFARQRESGEPAARYEFRTAPLLNVALTAPYGHDGAYATLADVLRHYRNPAGAVADYFAAGGWCLLPQFVALPRAECDALYPNAAANSQAALAKLQQDRANGAGLPVLQLAPGQLAELEAFLRALTDRCAEDVQCVRQWVPPDDGGPDDRQLRAVDAGSDPL
jgi:cytochrome c peroxidase